MEKNHYFRGLTQLERYNRDNCFSLVLGCQHTLILALTFFNTVDIILCPYLERPLSVHSNLNLCWIIPNSIDLIYDQYTNNSAIIKWLLNENVCTYGSQCVGRIVTQSMSYFLYLCDCSVPYCASLEAWNWVVAAQHLNASHPRSTVWPNPNVTISLGNYFWKTLNSHISSTIRAFDLFPKLKARPEYKL